MHRTEVQPLLVQRDTFTVENLEEGRMHWQQKRCCKRGVQDLHGLTMKMRDLEAYLERTWLLGHWHVFFTLQLPVTSVSTMFSTYDYILIVQIVLKTIYIDSIYMHIHSIFIYSMYNIVQYIYTYILHYISICISTPFTHVYMCVFLICSLMIVYHV